jgi:hypothetical protein
MPARPATKTMAWKGPFPAGFLRLLLAALVLAAAAGSGPGCVPQPGTPEYQDPAGAGPAAVAPPAQPAYSAGIGLVYSPEVKQTIAIMEQVNRKLASFGALANSLAIKDNDPTIINRGVESLLRNRYSKTAVLSDVSEAAAQGLALCLELSYSGHLGEVSGAKTSVYISGRFVTAGGAPIAAVSATGEETIPYPASTFMFKQAATRALFEFANAMDASPGLMAFLRREPANAGAASGKEATAGLEAEKARLAGEVEALRRQKEHAALTAEKARLEMEKASLLEQKGRLEAQTPGAGQDPAYSKRVALVIGNGRYGDAPLANPANDARAIAASLKPLGFDVSLLLEADRPGMERAVRAFAEKARGGVALFYFAGHGMQVEGENYLIPVGADIASEGEVRYEAVAVGRVLDNLRYADSALNIIILDACRNNPLKRSTRSVARGLAHIAAPKGTIISYSTAPGEVAVDGTGQHSPFAKAILANIAGKTPIETFFKQVGLAVAQETAGKQRPWISSDFLGMFSFAR